ncbi:MAG TPA: 30S ribosomal protein S9 [Thermoleophilia bacterium]|jgi:small subunit ribosomal protein S9
MAGIVYSATGKRKTSVARVRLMPGTGNITVNGKDVKEYFNRQTLMLVVRSPLVETGTESRYDVIAQTHGGGKSGQAGALKHGLARALVEADPSLRTEVKRAGHLSRDARMVERKKAGLKKARKRPQFSKR